MYALVTESKHLRFTVVKVSTEYPLFYNRCDCLLLTILRLCQMMFVKVLESREPQKNQKR